MDRYIFLLQLSYFNIKQSNEPLIWVDSKGTIKHLNETACRFSDFHYDKIMG